MTVVNVPGRAAPGKAGRPVGARQHLTREPRRLHLGHFAFMRAIIQGIPVRDSYERYLAHEEVPFRKDRLIPKTIAWLRDELAAASRKQSRHGVARLIELDLSQIPPSDPTLPNIDDWAAENGWDGFSENEILRAYQEAHAALAGKRLERRTRLVEKQLAAIRWLEELVAQKPGAGDACGAWFSPLVSNRLADADIRTVAQLIEHINGIGRHWYRSIRSIGPGKAQRIERWLHQHADSLGMQIGGHVAVPRSRLYPEELAKVVPAATAVRPLEKFVVPAELDGRAGQFRQPAEQCLMSAGNDYEAILAWIKSKRPMTPEAQAVKRARKRGRGGSDPNAPLAWLDVLSHTQRACRKEAERFLLWAILERRKPLSSMTTEDCIAYRDFLANPQPADTWCGRAGRERWSPLWRPFVGPLSVPAQHQAVTILKNLYRFLSDQNYLMGNPWVGVALPRKSQRGLNTGRSFTVAQWRFANQQLKTLDPKKESTLRLAVALSLLYATGIRLSEAVNAKVGDLNWVEYAGPDGATTGWEMTVVGKGEKLREVVVPQNVVGYLKAYLAARGLPADPNNLQVAGAYILAPLTQTEEKLSHLKRSELTNQTELSGDDPNQSSHQPIAANTLYSILKTYFMQCAGTQALTDEKSAQRFQKASTHWLRHTHASHTIASGVPIEVAQANLGHASMATTTTYVTTEKERRMREMLKVVGVADQ